MKNKRTTKEKIVLGLSVGGGLGILPFAIFRLSGHEWTVGYLDLVASLSMLSLFVFVLKTQKTHIATKILSAIALSTMVLTVYLKGIQQFYWAYPAIVSIFYLLKPKTGIIFVLITTSLILPSLYQQASLIQLATILVTLLITISFAYIFSTQMRRQQKLLIEQATKDPLTGAGNRRALGQKMTQIISSFQRTRDKCSLLLIDMDHFKKINDTFGHNAGDRFLTQITTTLNSRIRITDNLYRFGGEEFIVIAENTDLKAAQILAEELRGTIEKGEIISETEVTVSIGIAELTVGESDEEWIKRADKALFKAKESGRNKVCLSEA